MVDWSSTLLGLAGVPLDQTLAQDGRDAWPTIAQGEPSPHGEILLNATPLAGAIRVGEWKRIVRAPGADPKDDVHAGETPGPQTTPGTESVERFHLASDPNEAHECSAESSSKVAELRARYKALGRQALTP